ncbi:Unknown protein [Striga hermonthica]|uniref:Pectinesterase inhibitor domain-containing protein n=1 Tax=Striga hermonthica TaxID=68872 RepID=A0A9N7NZD7_STRHE|nr:Unknown protein [Striga hermonthica]
MAPHPIVSIFILTIFLLSLFSTNAIRTSSSDNPPPTSEKLIDSACDEPRLQSKSECKQVLQSQPDIISATDLYNLSIAIMRSGISYLCATLNYIEESLNETGMGPTREFALNNCSSSYDEAIWSTSSALSEVMYDDDYESATYDLDLAVTNDMQPCLDEVPALLLLSTL